jgi:hypothetical protein
VAGWFLPNAGVFLFWSLLIAQIEETLDFEQHRRFAGSGVNGIRYQTFGPKGHNHDLFVYALTSITGTVLGFAQGQASLWLLLQSDRRVCQCQRAQK